MTTISLRCGFCSGRGMNEHGSECQHCDCGQAEYDGDFIAMQESGDFAPYFDHVNKTEAP